MVVRRYWERDRNMLLGRLDNGSDANKRMTEEVGLNVWLRRSPLVCQKDRMPRATSSCVVVLCTVLLHNPI